MDGKSAFGYDFLFYMQAMSILASGRKSISGKASGAAILFLVEWGFDFNQVWDLEDKFQNDMASGNLDNPTEALERLVAHVKKDHLAVRRLIVHTIAIANLDGNMSQDALNKISEFSNYFNLENPEIEKLIGQGVSISRSLQLFESICKLS
jgi:hypothetical protein